MQCIQPTLDGEQITGLGRKKKNYYESIANRAWNLSTKTNYGKQASHGFINALTVSAI